MNPFSFNYFGSTITAQSLGTGRIPDDTQVLTACCVSVLDDGHIVAVNVTGRGVDIPGGHVDPGETPIQAMHRELFEEARITVDTPILIDTVLFTSDDEKLGLTEKPYMLMYAANVLKVETFTPNDEIEERLFLSPEAVPDVYFADSIYAAHVVQKALNALGM